MAITVKSDISDKNISEHYLEVSLRVREVIQGRSNFYVFGRVISPEEWQAVKELLALG